MEKKLSLLKTILNLNDSDIKEIINSKLTVHELIFSDSDYLRRCPKVDESLILKLAAIRGIVLDILS